MSIQDVVLKIKTTSTGSWTRTVALIGIIFAVAGPFLLLTIGGREANNLPWYIWVIAPLVLLTVIAAGFAMFNRTSTEAEDISIRPKPR
jgi:type IV secretory pathway VirB2 component (pilin)